MAQEPQPNPFELAADLSLAAFKTGMAFWVHWPLLMTRTETKVDEIKPAPATPEAISIVAGTIVPPPLKSEAAPVMTKPVSAVRPAASNWKPKELKKKPNAKAKAKGR